jgi:hypothetical protein
VAAAGLVNDYGSEHRAERARWAELVESGHGWCCEAVCLRSSRWIPPGSKWHLSHDPSGTVWTGVSHHECNESEGSRRRHGRVRRDWAPTVRW